ncbi:hypothetical protein [Celeribacter ethanolicus]|uniref:Uncharacterized protein n=1 Tax=Celeribacter ethanolicus TaxID=1758178 RepID=A0A291GB16_9RHOB|nr:hypothetical protein [Celeribacter ethanolicus]ATG47733.1 hypothetical protein CEW89_09235 [Celeribacter ethanolicus]TNE64018.1 MAG: hypothetical protein EP336_16170 [Paracoccaceae bacterium]
MDKKFQDAVHDWVLTCFGEEIAMDAAERNRRFLEEALELVQSLGASRTFAHELVDYVFSRPQGDAPQEIGGVMVTLASLCATHGIDLAHEAEKELSRIESPAIIARIRAKHAGKPQF